MLIVSEDGIEKLVDIEDHFHEVGFNIRPLFKNIANEEITEENTGNEYEDHLYYFMRKDIDISGNDVLTRLKRCY